MQITMLCNKKKNSQPVQGVQEDQALQHFQHGLQILGYPESRIIV